MEVILLENIRNLGRLGDKVTIKPGYARNFLIPQNKAVYATTKNIKAFEERRAELEKKAKAGLAKAEQRAAKINDTTVVIAALASEEGKLYGSISITDICNAMEERGLEVEKHEIVMTEGPIHAVGEYVIEIHVHSEVVAQLQVQVVPSK